MIVYYFVLSKHNLISFTKYFQENIAISVNNFDFIRRAWNFLTLSAEQRARSKMREIFFLTFHFCVHNFSCLSVLPHIRHSIRCSECNGDTSVSRDCVCFRLFTPWWESPVWSVCHQLGDRSLWGITPYWRLSFALSCCRFSAWQWEEKGLSWWAEIQAAEALSNQPLLPWLSKEVDQNPQIGLVNPPGY